MTEKDKNEFSAFLRLCTDAQVFGVRDKEKAAGRKDYLALANAELQRRGLE